MFLSDFSIGARSPTVVIIIALMCLGLLALKNLRVNQIPDVRAAGDGGEHPLSGRLAGDRRARDHQPHREGAAEHSAGRTRSAPPPRERQRADRHHLQLQEEHGRGLRRGPQRDRHRALQAAGRDARAGAAAHRSVGAADHAAGAVVEHADRTPRSRAWPRTSWPTASAASTAWRVVNVNGSLQPRALGAAARARSCASTTSR